MFVLGGVDMMYIRYIISSKARHMHSCQQLGILLASNLNHLLTMALHTSLNDMKHVMCFLFFAEFKV